MGARNSLKVQAKRFTRGQNSETEQSRARTGLGSCSGTGHSRHMIVKSQAYSLFPAFFSLSFIRRGVGIVVHVWPGTFGPRERRKNVHIIIAHSKSTFDPSHSYYVDEAKLEPPRD